MISFFFCKQYLHTTLENVTDRSALNLANAGIIRAGDAAGVVLDTTAVGFSVYLMVKPLYWFHFCYTNAFLWWVMISDSIEK